MPKTPTSVAQRPTIDVTFWGTRGSIPVPGPDTVRFGGNTACIEVSLDQNNRNTTIIIDGGSGIRLLGDSREWKSGQVVHLLLTHLHHDHVLGLPFFRAAYVTGLELHIWCGNLGGATAEDALDGLFSPPLFPVRLSDMPAKPVFHGFNAGETITVDGHRIGTLLLNHPSGSTGYRFGSPDGGLSVITDVEHQPNGLDPALVAFCGGVDTLVYDTMMDESEYGRCKGWGHSTGSEAIRLIAAAGGRRLVGFHHGPGHTDATMDRREATLRASWPDSLMAREGQTLRCDTANASQPNRSRPNRSRQSDPRRLSVGV